MSTKDSLPQVALEGETHEGEEGDIEEVD